MRTLYRARAVHTQSHPATGEWVLVDDRHVQRVGAGEPPVADRVVDLPGATITPGFVDTHVHLTPTGTALGNVEVEQAGDRGELLAIAHDRAEEATPTVWLQGFDETRWTDHGLPSLAELDAITSRPLAIWRADGHVCLANTAAIVQGGVGDLPGTERTGGAWTGRVRMEANDRLHRWFAQALSDHEVQELQLRAAALAAARGITSIHEMSMPAGHGLRDLEVVLSQRERLPVDVLPIVATMDVPQIMDLRLPTIGGDLPVDGSIGARTAALGAPYADGAGEGVTYYEDDVLEGFFLSGHAAGLQVGVHAIGDRAIEQVLSAWERVYATLNSRGRRHFRARRHRVEHIEMASAAQVERAAMLGLAASVQPAFDAAWGHPGGLYELGVGEERAAAMNPFRTMLDRGMEVGAGSDTPVTSLEPMRTVEALERHHHPAQRLTRAEAIRVSTIGGARLAHQEGKKGTLEPGSHADLVAWDDDPFTAVDVATVRPILTVSLGREVFSR
ncbi:MAG: amidohydrolase family protein [Actinomycetota bacterium]